uniref:Tripartite motif containing 35-30 n=1 Tax=Eptatretus burgeri TaxID=7764 RepID=A0A8C4RB71_EPTBU
MEATTALYPWDSIHITTTKIAANNKTIDPLIFKYIHPLSPLYSSPHPLNFTTPVHLFIFFRAPAHSFGPKFLIPQGITRHGNMAMPSFSMSARPRDTTKMTNLGPGSHKPERAMNSVYPTAPSYSMLARKKEVKLCSDTPGPAHFILPPVLGHGLVDKTSAPMYSFTGRSSVGVFYKNQPNTPGPASHNIPSMDAYKHKFPQYTMKPRFEGPKQMNMNPGPGTYRPEKVTATHRQLPSYSFGIKHSEYKLPVLLGS